MPNLWLVAQHEYTRTVVRRGFLIGTLAVPVAMAALIGVIILMETSMQDHSPLGYVDQAGLLEASRQAALPNAADRIPIRAFADEASAQAALEQSEIQAFFVFPANYLQSLKTDLYYLQRPPSAEVWRDFDDFVRINLVAAYPPEAQARIMAGPVVTVRDLASGREFSERGILNIILPVAASVFFLVATLSASGYLLGVVASEKENRTMEVLLTAVTPGQLIGGKTLGLLAATLTQLLVYVVAAVIALMVGAGFLPEFREVIVPWEYLGMLALFFLPAYVFLAAIMIALGAAMPDLQQGQQAAGLLNLLFGLPLFFSFLIFEDPAGPAAITLTLLPFTAFLTVALRWGFGSIPLWQLALSWTLLVGSALCMVWAAVRILRAGMLSYGQPLSLRAAWAAVRNQ